jgi:hypothetical protein
MAAGAVHPSVTRCHEKEHCYPTARPALARWAFSCLRIRGRCLNSAPRGLFIPKRKILIDLVPAALLPSARRERETCPRRGVSPPPKRIPWAVFGFLSGAQIQNEWRRRMSLASTLGTIIDIGSRPTASVRVPIPGAEARRAARTSRAGSPRRLLHRSLPLPRFWPSYNGANS